MLGIATPSRARRTEDTTCTRRSTDHAKSTTAPCPCVPPAISPSWEAVPSSVPPPPSRCPPLGVIRFHSTEQISRFPETHLCGWMSENGATHSTSVPSWGLPQGRSLYIADVRFQLHVLQRFLEQTDQRSWLDMLIAHSGFRNHTLVREDECAVSKAYCSAPSKRMLPHSCK